VYAGLTLFGLLYAPVDFFTSLLAMLVSRHHEYAADRYAVATTGGGQALARALRKLAVHHLANLSPHPFHVFLNYSHPPIVKRIEAIQQLSGQTRNDPTP